MVDGFVCYALPVAARKHYPPLFDVFDFAVFSIYNELSAINFYHFRTQ